VEQYAHYVAGSSDGFIYVGIGTSKANIAAYEIATGAHREILPAENQVVGQANVYRGEDGNVYGTLAGKHFRLKGWTATLINASEASPAKLSNRLRDGRVVEVHDSLLKFRDTKTGAVTERKFDYKGNLLPLFRVQLGPDGELYGSSVLPIHFIKVDGLRQSTLDLGGLGGGEIYSFLSRKNQLLMAAYGGLAPLMAFDTRRPFEAGNPKLVNFPGSDSGWRPQSMINGSDGRVYLGAMSGYGKLGGPLTVWDVDAGTVEQFHHLIPNQSVITLTTWKDRIIGGTNVGGGGGSHPTEKEAKLFIWDPKTKKKEFETVPVEGAGVLNDLITAPNGLVYGTAGRTLFVFDPETRTIKDRKPLPVRGTIYSSIALGPGGLIWGLAPEGIFTVDTKTNEFRLVARTPEKITGGFALRGNEIYFISGASVYRYTIASR
jgi:hypothetical protein